MYYQVSYIQNNFFMCKILCYIVKIYIVCNINNYNTKFAI